MPQTESAKKALRSGLRKRAANDSWRRRVREALHEVRSSIASDNKDKAKAAITEASSALDRAARRYVIPRNKAARFKSRLQKALDKVGK